MDEQSKGTPAERRNGERVETKLLRIAEKAAREPELKFVNLYYLMNEELLNDCYRRVRKDAAAGVDEVTKEEYGRNLAANLRDLVDRLHRMSYRPQAVRRTYVPKAGSDKLRPLGIPTLEDKLVGMALARILGAIYEQDFIESSYGFRPARSCHDALGALSHTVQEGNTNYIVEADIKKFFDSVDHDWMMKMLLHRVGDQRVQRLVKRFLIAGIVEDGERYKSDEGTPQGASLSPILANIYLHYALDLWFERVYRKKCKGKARLIRYADDFVVCFQNREDAMEFKAELEQRLAKFALSLEPTKTKVLEFGPCAAKSAAARGEKPGTFDFLGFTHYNSKSATGKRYRMKRVTARKKYRAKLAEFKKWIKRARTEPLPKIMRQVAAKLRGHYSYYGVSDNSGRIGRFRQEVLDMLYKWLNRRSQKRSYNPEQFKAILYRFRLPKPRIVVNLHRPERMFI
jgi:group II intron reverse transcriptase/maturase